MITIQVNPFFVTRGGQRSVSASDQNAAAFRGVNCSAGRSAFKYLLGTSSAYGAGQAPPSVDLTLRVQADVDDGIHVSTIVYALPGAGSWGFDSVH